MQTWPTETSRNTAFKWSRSDEDARPESATKGEIHQWFGEDVARTFVDGYCTKRREETRLRRRTKRRSVGATPSPRRRTRYPARADVPDDALASTTVPTIARRNARALGPRGELERLRDVRDAHLGHDRRGKLRTVLRRGRPVPRSAGRVVGSALGPSLSGTRATRCPHFGARRRPTLQDAWVLTPDALAALRGGGENTAEETLRALRRYESIRKPRRRRSRTRGARVIGFDWEKPGAGSCPTCATPRSRRRGSWGSRGRSSSRTRRSPRK